MINKNKILKSVVKDKKFKTTRDKPLKIEGTPRPEIFDDFIDLMIKLGYFAHSGNYGCNFTIEGIRTCFKDKCTTRETTICANTKTKRYHHSWIYFPRYYTKYIKLFKTLRGLPKQHLISWIGGNYRSKKKRRNYHLVKHCDFIHDSTKKYRHQNSKSLTIPYEQFLVETAKSKFCLCLPGFGSKCHREIEALGLGTVLAVTDGVNVDYFNKLVENKHYVTIKNEKDFNKLNNIDEEEYLKMSYACSRWFDENISPSGAYRVTRKLVHSIRNQ